MTVPSEVSSAIYTSTGVTATYAYSWQIARESDLIVYEINVAGTVATQLTLNTDYTVTGVGVFTGGTIILTAGIPASGIRVFVASDPEQIQQVLLQQGAAFNPADIMHALDLLTREVQACRRIASQSIQFPVAQSLDGFAAILPTAAVRANQAVTFDANGSVTLGVITASVWRSGAGVPSNSLGNNGDWYLNTSTGQIYTKTGGAYLLVATFTGAGYGPATSTSSLVTAGSGSKTFATQPGMAYSAGARIRATSRGTAEWMEGIVSSYSGSTLIVTMDLNSGTGTHVDWDINLTGQPSTVPGANGLGYRATSASSLATSASGSKAFNTQASLAYTAGARIRATSAGTGEWMEGIVSAYSGTTLTVTMDLANGSGTHADWDINAAGQPGSSVGTQPVAWVAFEGNGTGAPSIISQFNVASVARTSVGKFTVTFTSPLTDANYAIVGSAQKDLNTSSRIVELDYNASPTTSACQMVSSDTDTGNPRELTLGKRYSVAFFGT